MKKPLVTFLTLVFNCENYIAQTIESVLNQSESNIEYIIRDNGSTDSTGAICQKYAYLDSRITFLHNDVNWMYNSETPLLATSNMFSTINGEYVCHLDGDDYLSPDFVSKMYPTAKDKNADIVICGTTMFKDTLPDEKYERIPPSVVISLDCSISDNDFISLYGSLRPLWGKIFKTSFYQEHLLYTHSFSKDLQNVTDTYISLSYCLKASVIVSISNALHFYRIRDTSSYNSPKVESIRIKSGEILFNKGIELLDYLKIRSNPTEAFLYRVHFEYIKDHINLVNASSQMSNEEKIVFFEELLTNAFFCNYILESSYENDVFNTVGKFYYILNKILVHNIELEKFFSVRLFKTYFCEHKSEQSLIMLLSGLCDPHNKHLWGIHLFVPEFFSEGPKWFSVICFLSRQQKYILFKNPTTLCNLVNSSLDELKVSNLKQAILDLIDMNNYISALDHVKKLLDIRPLDREGLYFKIYICYVLGDFVNALETSYITRSFWYTDDEVIKMCCNIENKILSKAKSK